MCIACPYCKISYDVQGNDPLACGNAQCKLHRLEVPRIIFSSEYGCYQISDEYILVAQSSFPSENEENVPDAIENLFKHCEGFRSGRREKPTQAEERQGADAVILLGDRRVKVQVVRFVLDGFVGELARKGTEQKNMVQDAFAGLDTDFQLQGTTTVKLFGISEVGEALLATLKKKSNHAAYSSENKQELVLVVHVENSTQLEQHVSQKIDVGDRDISPDWSGVYVVGDTWCVPLRRSPQEAEL